MEGLHSVPMLSMDLEGNRARELGAMRSAEVAAVHLTLQFLNLADDEIGFQCEDYFLALVYGASASSCLSVLDLRDNFFDEVKKKRCAPPEEMISKLLTEGVAPGEFDPAEVKEAIFIRRQRVPRRSLIFAEPILVFLAYLGILSLSYIFLADLTYS